MPSLRDIRTKIKSVKATEQITKAMKMVAAARMRRSQAAILAARPFAVKLDELVRGLAAIEHARSVAEGRAERLHEFFVPRAGGPELLVLITADKGLCGAFNSNLLRFALDWLRKRQDRKVYAVVVGRKARDFMHRLKGFDLDIVHELAGIFPRATFTHAELLGEAVIEAYLKKNISSVTA